MMEEEDFELTELATKIGEASFRSSDPVWWRARLMPPVKHRVSLGPEIRTKFPHQYIFVFSAHHALGDGINDAFMLASIVHILENVLSGEPVDREQVAELTDKKDLKLLKQRMKDNLLSNEKRLEEVRNSLPTPDKTPLLQKIFNKPGNTPAGCKHVPHNIEIPTLEQFQVRCKQAGASLNSSVLAAVNTAIVELAKESGMDQATYTVTANVQVNLRNLLETPSIFQTGPLNYRLSFSSQVDNNVKNSFWKYCKTLHQELRSHFKSGLALEQAIVTEIDQSEKPLEEYFSNPSPVLYDYGHTNPGSIYFDQDNKNVYVRDVFVYSLVQNFCHSNYHHFTQFNDRCWYMISYDTRYMNEEMVNKLADKIVAVMTDVTKIP